MKPVESDRLDAEERRELSSSDFGIPEERAFPMPDAAHVRACRESCGAVLGREIVVV